MDKSALLGLQPRELGDIMGGEGRWDPGAYARVQEQADQVFIYLNSLDELGGLNIRHAPTSDLIRLVTLSETIKAKHRFISDNCLLVDKQNPDWIQRRSAVESAYLALTEAWNELRTMLDSENRSEEPQEQ